MVKGDNTTAVGRPRDPDVECRALETALEIFSRKGWFGFTIGAVAQRAKVGKSAIYLRWGSREQLLLDAFREIRPFEETSPDVCSVREAVAAHLVQRVTVYFTPVGLALMRLQVEYEADPEQFDASWRTVIGASLETTRALLTSASEKGELVAGAPTSAIAEALDGVCLARAVATPVSERSSVLSELDGWAQSVIAHFVEPWLAVEPA
ncbi:transcriptional regulator, TetR family [Austwickia chelonae]|uniref:TetR/AcrR family transcriptional regulator n=1 Tax=Austwickia chelonae TaxID=100225 RepID=UPI0003060589|nr:TetR/AcrR family transcriptional regulator [Austwickia chelonae]SEV98797.1 transcriptional regulator, TetR family [Austwickia chelonae]